MTNYEKIKFLLEMGVYKGVEVKTYDYRYVILSKSIDGLGLITDLGEEMGQRKINSLDITSITPIPNPPKLLPVGTKVRVFEEYANPEDYEGEVIEGIIIDVLDDEACYNIDIGSNNWDNIPARAVYPVLY